MLNERVHRGGQAVTGTLVIVTMVILVFIWHVTVVTVLLILVQLRTDIDTGQFAILVIDYDADQWLRTRSHDGQTHFLSLGVGVYLTLISTQFKYCVNRWIEIFIPALSTHNSMRMIWWYDDGHCINSSFRSGTLLSVLFNFILFRNPKQSSRLIHGMGFYFTIGPWHHYTMAT